MTDREMLELAAKAAGAEVTGMRGNLPVYGMPVEDEDCCTYTRWDPLNDDGDALRLAILIPINIELDMAAVEANAVLTDISVNVLFSEFSDDPYAATRRAIVRCAAEIGRRMIKENKP